MNYLARVISFTLSLLFVVNSLPQNNKFAKVNETIASLTNATNSVFVANRNTSDHDHTSHRQIQQPSYGTNTYLYGTPYWNVAPGIGEAKPKYPGIGEAKPKYPGMGNNKFTPPTLQTTYVDVPSKENGGTRNGTSSKKDMDGDLPTEGFSNQTEPRILLGATRSTTRPQSTPPRTISTTPLSTTSSYSNHGLGPRLTTNGNVALVTSHPNRKDLCGTCLCTRDTKYIVCEHTHTLHEDRKHQLTLRKAHLPREAVYIRIKGYDKVIIEPETFSDNSSKLRLIVFEEIRNLSLQRNSFLFGAKSINNMELVLEFTKCDIPVFPSGALTQMEEDSHGRQGRVDLQNTRFLSVEFNKCKIGVLETNSISAARLMYFNITDSRIQHIKEKAIDIDVYELCKIRNCQLPPLVKNAMCFHSKKTVFSANLMEDIQNRSINIETDGQVLFEFNQVGRLRNGALSGIKPMRGVYGASIVFLMNSVDVAEPSSLYIDAAFPAHERKVLNNSFFIECACNISKQFEIIMNINLAQSSNKATYRNVIENSQCHELESNNFITIDTYLMTDCAPFPMITVGAIIAAIILFVIAVTVCVVCSLRVQQVKEEANILGECTSQSFSTLSRNDLDNHCKYPPVTCQSPTCQTPLWNMTQWVAAVPEIKTYQQTDVPEFTEQTESICGSIRGSLMRGSLAPVEGRVLARGSCPFN